MRKITILILFLTGAIIVSCQKDNLEPEPEIEESGYRSIDLISHYKWHLSSVPKRFPESNLNNDLSIGFNRAKIAWYVIDPLFLRNNSLTPFHILNDLDQQSSHLVREIFKSELFPEQEQEASISTVIEVLNLAYYPEERGSYNYDTYSSDYSEGINTNGLLNNPESRWSGIQREISTTGIAFDTLDFWLMDPFVYNENVEGDLYIDYGDISEDILQDSRKSFEDGFPIYIIDNVDTTVWGRIPGNEYSIGAFRNIDLQDLGLDGLEDEDEKSFFREYLDAVCVIINDEDVIDKFRQDPSNDNFRYYNGAETRFLQLNILDSYKKYNNVSGNSSEFPEISTQTPDAEETNNDNILQIANNYVEYKVPIKKSEFEVGQNFIVEKRFGNNVDLANGEQDVEIAWYHFKIPINEYSNSYGSAPFDGTARTIRIYLTNFEEEVILRFATLNLFGYFE